MKKRVAFGLKLYSTNLHYIREAQRLFEKGTYEYIELYVVPGSYATHSRHWADLEIPFIVHAPHFLHGMNLSRREYWNNNKKLIGETREFADSLEAPTIIVHPGIAGDYRETIVQLRRLSDRRFIVENKPFIALNGKRCVGAAVEEIKSVMRECKIGLCLDIGHAIKSAWCNNADPYDVINEFIRLKPGLLHLCDGKIDTCFDEHMHIGRGQYDWSRIFKILYAGISKGRIRATIETEKKYGTRLSDFVGDVDALESYAKGRR